ncbi:MAG: hypothetical protein N2578_06990 [Bdellovibrionaceae bacterium]|nr:hypothetical protein [Pseudobdellovibrionaceae bacterium]
MRHVLPITVLTLSILSIFLSGIVGGAVGMSLAATAIHNMVD